MDKAAHYARQALELVWSGEDQARTAGMDILKNLGAHAALSRAHIT